MPWLLHVNLKAETHDATNCCDTSPQQVTAMNRLMWHVKIIVAVTEFCHCNLFDEFKPVWIRATYRSDKISASSLVTACAHICDKSRWHNLNQPMQEHQLVSRDVNFELAYISSLPKSRACTEQVSHCSNLLQQLCRRGDLSQRCVTAICCIVCLGFKALCNFHYTGLFLRAAELSSSKSSSRAMWAASLYWKLKVRKMSFIDCVAFNTIQNWFDLIWLGFK